MFAGWGSRGARTETSDTNLDLGLNDVAQLRYPKQNRGDLWPMSGNVSNGLLGGIPSLSNVT